jgi:hypothetical protein
MSPCARVEIPELSPFRKAIAGHLGSAATSKVVRGPRIDLLRKRPGRFIDERERWISRGRKYALWISSTHCAIPAETATTPSGSTAWARDMSPKHRRAVHSMMPTCCFMKLPPR